MSHEYVFAAKVRRAICFSSALKVRARINAQRMRLA